MRAITAFLIALSTLVISSPGGAQPPADRYAPVLSRVRSLKHSPYARVMTIGRSGEGRTISAILLTDPNDAGAISRERERVLFICAQHGDEPSSVKAMLSFAEELAHGDNPTYRSVLKRVVVCIVPVANPDGFSHRRRMNGSGEDLNRDWDSLRQPETLAISRLVSRFRPRVIVDEHEWLDGASQRDNSVEIADSGHAAQFRLQRLLAGCLTGRLARDGVSLRTARYDSAADPGLAHRWFADHGICSFLVETSANWSPHTRVKAHRAFASALLLDVAFPPSRQVSDGLSKLANAGRSADASIAELYAPRSPAMLPPFVVACLAIFAVIGCAVIRSSGPDTRRDDTLRIRRPGPVSLALSDVLELDLSPRMKAAVLRQCRLRPTDRQDALRKPIPETPVLLDPFENRALGRRWDSSIRRKPLYPSDSRMDRRLSRGRIPGRRIGIGSLRLRAV